MQEDTIMNKNIIAALMVSTLLAAGSAYAADHFSGPLRGHAKTIDEAFSSGVKMAKNAGFELGEEKDCNKSYAKIKILPKKENGLYVVEVYSSPHKSPCGQKSE